MRPCVQLVEPNLIKGPLDERLIGAARSDNVELLEEIFAAGGFDINFKDGWVSATKQAICVNVCHS